MPNLLTPPFPFAGTGILAVELVLASLIVSLFWVTYPEGFTQLGVILIGTILGCWAFAHLLSVKVRSTQSKALEQRARAALIVGALFGMSGLFFGFIGGPHVAGVAAWGVGAQLLVLILGRISLAI